MPLVPLLVSIQCTDFPIIQKPSENSRRQVGDTYWGPENSSFHGGDLKPGIFVPLF